MDLSELIQLLDPAEIAASILPSLLEINTQASSGHPIKRTVLLVGDLDLYKKLLPKIIFDKGLYGSAVDRFTVSFLLRHQISELAMAGHAAAGLKSERGHAYTNAIKNDDFTYDAVPLFGFSALGLHAVLCRKGACRAFDYHDLQYCSAHALPDSVFCESHQCEAFYDSNNTLAGATVQAKMLRFYANLDNLDAYSESELQNLLGQFWKKMKHPSFSVDNALLIQAAKRLGFNTPEEIRQLGMQGLRKLFLKVAFQSHPDRGGKASHFIAIKESYDYLKAWLA